MPTVAELLAMHRQLTASDTPRLDAEVLLAHCLDKPRSYLYTWPDREVAGPEADAYRRLLARRSGGEPIAHLTGTREFWSLRLAVDGSTLIPRPDTERLVEIALACTDAFAASSAVRPIRVLDLGTGSGAIALALASERPAWRVTGAEREAAALALAERNRRACGLANVGWLRSDWFAAVPNGERFHTVVGNPPYIDAGDAHLGEGDVRFEPRSALVAAEGGLADIRRIAAAASNYLLPRGWLLLEHGAEQGLAVRALLAERNFRDVQTWRDEGHRERVSGGRAPAAPNPATDPEFSSAAEFRNCAPVARVRRHE